MKPFLAKNVKFRLLRFHRNELVVLLFGIFCITSNFGTAQDAATTSEAVSGVPEMEIVRTPVVPPPARVYPSLRIEESGEAGYSDLRSKYSVPPYSLGFRGRGIHAPRFGRGRARSLERAFSDATDYNSTKNSLLNINVTESIENIDTADLRGNIRDKNKFSARGGIEFDLDRGHFKANSLDADRDAGLLKIDGDVEITNSESRLTADSFFLQRSPMQEITEEDRIRYRLVPHGHDPYEVSKLGDGVLEAYNLDYMELKRAFKADYIRYDSMSHAGVLTGVKGYSDPFYFGADQVRIIGPSTFEVDNIWLTTCDLDDPHYRIRFSQARVEEGRLVVGKETKLQIGKKKRTFFYIPQISGLSITGEDRLRLEIETGQQSELGYYLNIAQWYTVTPNVDLAYRLYPSANEGLGFGLDGEYDFRQNPASRLFGSKGEFETLYTTKERGYTQWYHRQELSQDLTLLTQWEQWYDRDFVKDFYNDEYEDRSGPRTFTNLTYLKDGYIATGTASKSTHDFVSETEKLPEATFHLLERQLGEGLYLSLDSVAGYYNHSGTDVQAQRYSQVARLSYDFNVMRGMNILPFVEGSTTHYSETLTSDDAESRVSGLAGVTTQFRFQRGYAGRGKFDGFKHIIVPSVTYFHENSSSIDADDVPRFDSIDIRPSRERIESKIDNLILGRNSENGQVWRVAKLTLYQGNDISNETGEATDYEVDMEIRLRPWWGIRTFAEQHRVDEAIGVSGHDFDRVLSYIFYDDNNFENSFNARLGYALTDAGDITVNREILYGIGYKLSKKWSFSADHTYDLDDSEIRRQSYQINRRLHKWSMGLRIRDRPRGTDVNVVMSLIGFSGTRVSF